MKSLRPIFALALTAAIVLGAMQLYYGELNQDEGWYLLAARNVADGQMPYRDFAFTQGPVLPYVYALIMPLVREHGLMAGRIFTAILGLIAALFAARLAGRLASDEHRTAASIIAFTFIVVNAYHSYFTTVVKTYSVCAALLTLGVLLAVRALRQGGAGWAMLGGFLIALAAGARLSCVFVLPVFAIALAWPGVSKWREAIWFTVGGTAGVALVSVPFLLAAPDNYLFGVFSYHTSRSGGGLVFKAGFIHRVLQAYLAFAAFTMGYLIARRMLPPVPNIARSAVFVSVLVMTAIHFLAPFPYDDYQTPVYPLAAAWLASGLVALPGPPGKPGHRPWIVLFTCVLIAAASPVITNLAIRGRELIWWKTRATPPLVILQQAAREIRDAGGVTGDVLLTQDTYLAVETGMRVPQGLEMGPFSYYHDWNAELASSRRVVNTELLEKIIHESPASVAALSGYSFAISSPTVTPIEAPERQRLTELVTAQFQPVGVVQNFGQAETPLVIYKRIAP